MKRNARSTVAAGILTIAVVAAVVTGVLLAGSPAVERARRLDERRVRDLADIARAIDLYWTRHQRVPDSLHELGREPGANVRAMDPATNAPYEFRPFQAETYELCAHFERDTPQGRRLLHDPFWAHGSGRQCFRREARAVR